MPKISPPNYLQEICEILRESWPDAWAWAQSEKQAKLTSEAIQLDLLRSTVRMEKESHSEIYELAEQAANRLGLECPITLYQDKQSGHLNASISGDVNHAHIVFQGDLQDHLDSSELSSVIGHELGHHLLWQLDGGQYLVAINLLLALSQVSQSSSESIPGSILSETLRLFSQNTEVFCDRCALEASGDLQAVIASLIKVVTGVKTVNVDDYRRQADEIFEKDSATVSNEVTHPEMFIRVKTLELWEAGDAKVEEETARMLRGKLSLQRMDLVRQKQAGEITRGLVDHLLQPEWMQCEATLEHAQLYFDKFRVRKSKPGSGELGSIKAKSEDDFLDYLGYVMLDFVSADRDIMEPALAHSIELAGVIGIRDRFIASARKELRLRKKQVQDIEKNANELLEKAQGRVMAKEGDAPKSKTETRGGSL